ncbi:MAG: 3-demethylubiquinone-9 3-O-methyltransferase [Myxococcaceae bacterium]|nr:MAG: 3-demethylubiquinone-9 3-O-methyltransferase [Myxococcaceae bacterium]
MAQSTPVNNRLYDALGTRWYEAQDDPVALLRAESRLKTPWVLQRIARHLGRGPARVLDVGCGGGFGSNALAEAGHQVTGIDLSAESLRVARHHDRTGSVDYREADAYALPFEPGCFDVVTCMDFLEHVEAPALVVAEAARVLAPGGLFFFHTFNRNLLAGLVIIKGVEWFVANTPDHLHVLRLFITPDELGGHCEAAGLQPREWVGLRPHWRSRAFLRTLLTRRVAPDFRFVFTPSLRLSYLGFAVKPPTLEG